VQHEFPVTIGKIVIPERRNIIEEEKDDTNIKKLATTFLGRLHKIKKPITTVKALDIPDKSIDTLKYSFTINELLTKDDPSESESSEEEEEVETEKFKEKITATRHINPCLNTTIFSLVPTPIKKRKERDLDIEGDINEDEDEDEESEECKEKILSKREKLRKKLKRDPNVLSIQIPREEVPGDSSDSSEDSL